MLRPLNQPVAIRTPATLIIMPVVVVALVGRACRAGDWPQILGPSRNGIAAAETLETQWEPAGPRQVWKLDLGEGFAGPAVVGERVVIFHRLGNIERVQAVNATTGRSSWQTDYEASYQGGVNPDRGPRCVPTIAGGKVYVLGAAGMLHCLQLADGKKIWSRDTWADFDAPEGYFGAGSSPLVIDGKLLVNVGGRQAGIVAFDLANGKTLWTATEDGPSYSSPTSTTLDGAPVAVFVTRLQACIVAPRDGKVLAQFPFGQRGPTVNAAMPIVVGDRLFVTASYGVGARLVKLAPSSIATVWSNDESMSSQYNTAVHHGGSLYGIHGREDVGVAQLRCIDLQSGNVQWSVPDFGVANLILAGDHLLILGVDGTLTLAKADPSSFQQLAQARLTSDTTRALPALANGRLYFRTTTDQRTGKLMCYRVGQSR
jgi:outer membrane protein assembly factor BamB